MTKQALEIDREHFRNVMRLIAIVQEGYEATTVSLKKYGMSVSVK